MMLQELLRQHRRKARKSIKLGPYLTKPDLCRMARKAGLPSRVDVEKDFWTSSRLRRLKVGSLVWYRYPSYPFWPAKVSAIERPSSKKPEIVVISFGDGAREKVIKPNQTLRFFRCAKFDAYVRTGALF